MSANQLAAAASGITQSDATKSIALKSAKSFYDDYAVRNFSIMAVVWGVVGMLMGVVIASQLAFPELNLGIAWTSFGRLRPLHTNLVIFAFGGCALFATSYYIVQRTCQTTLSFPLLSRYTFWGYQIKNFKLN